MLRSVIIASSALAAALFLTACALTPTPADMPVEDARADQVIAAATAALGHDRFTVCYVPGSTALLSDAAHDGLSGVIGVSSTVKGTAAGLMENYRAQTDVVVEGPNAGRADRAARDALTLLDKPMPGLDLVLLHPPSAELQALAAKYAVTLHVIRVEG